MTKIITTKEIYNELKDLKKDIKFIKKHIMDIDTIMTPEEEKIFEKSIKEDKEGKSTSLEDFEKEMDK